MEETSIRFGRFTLDTLRRELFVDGRPTGLVGKPCELLDVLIRHGGRWMTRDEILEHVWPGVIVEPGAVAVAIHAIRKAFAKAGDSQEYILTLKQPVRYRFVGEIDALLPAAEPQGGLGDPGPSRGRWGPWALAAVSILLIVTLGALAISHWLVNRPPTSIAVLPFRFPAGNAELATLADNITDDLAADLSHLPRTQVSARSSAEHVRNETPQRIGRDLDVLYILDGTLTAQPNGRYRVDASLIDAASGTTLWQQPFPNQQEYDSTLRLDIVSQIASQLHLALDQRESERLAADRPNNPGAWALFFQARHKLDWDESFLGYKAAQTLLEAAVRQEPDFADAQAELGWILLVKAGVFDDPDDERDFAEAGKAIARALDLSPQNVLGRAARARQLEMDGKCDAAVPIATQIVEADRSNLDARTVLARCAEFVPDLDESAAEYRAILRLDPFSPRNKLRHSALGTVLLVQGHVPEAVEQLDQCREPAAPGDSLQPPEQCWLFLIAAHMLQAEQAQARAEFQDYAKQFHGRTVWRLSAYFPAVWQPLAGFQRFQRALSDSGMEEFADENAAGLADNMPCGSGDFAPTPRSYSGIKIIFTPEFRSPDVQTHALIIDLGRGRIDTPAAWFGYAKAQTDETQSTFALRIAHEQVGTDTRRNVVVLGDGVAGCAPLNAALDLTEAGFSHVAWYRGGEEAFFRSGAAKLH